MNSKEKLSSNLEITRRNGTDSRAINLNSGLSTTKNAMEAHANKVYESSFEITSLIRERTFTTMVFPAVFDSIGNNLIKIGIGIASIISAIGYLIEKIKH